LRKWREAIALGVICFILLLAIIIQMNTIDEMTREVGGFSLIGNQERRNDYLRARTEYRATISELQRTEERLANIRSLALANNEEYAAREIDLTRYNAILGLTEIRGNGITILLDDNRDEEARETFSVSGLLIHEEDILNIINELFNAGADAISVADERTEQRIVSTTAIMCDGNVIRVNGEIIGVPVTIRAIGSTTGLYHALNRPGGYLEILRNHGITVLVIREDNVAIPRFEGIHRDDYIN